MIKSRNPSLLLLIFLKYFHQFFLLLIQFSIGQRLICSAHIAHLQNFIVLKGLDIGHVSFFAVAKSCGVQPWWPEIALLSVFGCTTISLLELTWMHHLEQLWINIGCCELYLLLGVFIQEIFNGVKNKRYCLWRAKHVNNSLFTTNY